MDRGAWQAPVHGSQRVRYDYATNTYVSSDFSNESAICIRWPKYWSFSISPSNEYSGMIFFRIDGFDLLAVQRSLKSLLQHHNSKASVLWCSTFFMVQLSHPYMTTWKIIVLIIWTLVGKVMSLLFNTLSRFVITFFPTSERFLVLWLQSPSAVILEPREIKYVTVSTFSPSICHELMGPDAMILVFFECWVLSQLLLKTHSFLYSSRKPYKEDIITILILYEKAEPQRWLRWLSNMTSLACLKARIWTQEMGMLDRSSRDLFDK